ncbi:MAG: hypothetical protein M3440_01610 [Chloroflexota bacterium]|nr:hypothetical protein [Chloroflexota bacterium]
MGYGSERPRTWTKAEKLAGATAGAAGGAAYAATMAADLRLFRYNADDYLLLGGAVGLRPGPASRVGKGIHLVNSIALGMLFERLAYHRLPYSAAVNGAVFATVENAVLYPVFIVEHLHPLIRSGDLPSYKNGAAFTQSVVRHLAYGAIAGWTLDFVLKRSDARR